MCGISKDKTPTKVIIFWISLVSLVILFSSPELPNPNHEKNHINSVDAIVFIAMGTLAEDPIVDSALASVRVLGGWKGNLYLLTDRKDCFGTIATQHQVNIVSIPTVDSIIQIKALKSHLFDYLPTNITTLLYLDVDILVTRSLQPFFSDIADQLRHGSPDFGMFLDAGGHFFGFCSGCDKWHTGIILLNRTSELGKICMDKWREILLSGKYDTDQESIDEAERTGACKHTLALPSRHLLFAKDYFAAFLTPGRTFVHVTAISRLDTQDAFYRHYVVPSVKSSLRPSGLNLAKYEKQKKCVELATK
jgi:hypothetical protein